MIESNDTDGEDWESPVPSTFGFLIFLLGLFLVLTSSLTILVLNKCTKLVFQVKFASIHLTVSNLIYGLTITACSIYYVAYGDVCVGILKFVSFCFTTYYLFLTIIGLDRLLSLKLAMKYTFWTKRRNAIMATVCTYGIALILSIPNVIDSGGKFTCKGHPRDILTYRGLVIFSLTLLILLLIQVVSYGYIGINVLSRYASSRDSIQGCSFTDQKDHKHFWKVTVKSFHLCVLSALFIGPFIVSKMMEAFTQNADDGTYQVTALLLVLTYIHQVVSPIFILLTHKECRYTFLIIIYHFNKEKRLKLDSEYKQHYASYGISVIPDMPSQNNTTNFDTQCHI